MPKITLPCDAGVFRIQSAYAGNYIVLNDRTGKNQVIIACRDREHAEKICQTLSGREHNGEIWV